MMDAELANIPKEAVKMRNKIISGIAGSGACSSRVSPSISFRFFFLSVNRYGNIRTDHVAESATGTIRMRFNTGDPYSSRIFLIRHLNMFFRTCCHAQPAPFAPIFINNDGSFRSTHYNASLSVAAVIPR